MQRRDLLGLLPAGLPVSASAAAPRRLRTLVDVPESGFDPPRVSDRTSVTINAHIFESLFSYDPLAQPAQLVLQTAARFAEVSADHRHFVFSVQPGIFFADDPAFGGQARELLAADYVYAIKRYFDPRVITEHLHFFEQANLLGLNALRQRALAAKTGLDFDTEVPGLRVLDRYRFECRLAAPTPRFVALFAVPGLTGAVAREVVERYGDALPAHPVGTGPYRLKSWRRGSRIVLERNPRFRLQRYAAEPPPGDAQAQAMAERLRGRALPFVDEIEIGIVQEEQPRWLAFAGGEVDVMEMPATLAPAIVPGGQLAPHLRKRGVSAYRFVDATVRQTFFNTQDADIGGNSPERVALRRAIAMAYDNEAEVRLVFRGQGVPAQSLLVPGVTGFDARFKSELGTAAVARAKALLDVYGYREREGWRAHPDGRPLVLRLAGLQDSRQRAINEIWAKQMRAIGLRIEFQIGQFGELIKNSLAGRLQMWGFSWSTALPDGEFFLGLAYGPNAGQSNDARWQLPAYDRAYERQGALPDGPERAAAMRECQRLMQAYVPYLPHLHAVRVDLSAPGVVGYRRHPFTREAWKFTAIA